MADDILPNADLLREKLRAEIDQIRAAIEAQKATTASAISKDASEIASVRAPFYRKATFWTTVVPVFTATVSVFFYLNNQFNADYAKMKSDLAAAQTNYQKAQVDLADFKNQQATEKSKAVDDRIAAANAQLDTLQKELAAKTQEAGNEPIVTLMSAIEARAASSFPELSWEDALQGHLEDLAKANPNAPALLKSGMEETTNVTVKAQFALIAALSTQNAAEWKAFFDLGTNAINERLDEYNFWSLFDGRYDDKTAPEVKKQGCEIRGQAYLAGVKILASDNGKMADAVVSDLESCLSMPGEADPGQDARDAAAQAAFTRLLRPPIEGWTAGYTARVISLVNPLAALLLFADRWQAAGFPDDWKSAANNAISTVVTGAATGAPTAQSGIDDWKAFLQAHQSDLRQIKSSPPEKWPKL